MSTLNFDESHAAESDHVEVLHEALPFTRTEAVLLEVLEAEMEVEALEWQKNRYHIHRPDGCQNGIKFVGALATYVDLVIQIPD